MAREWREDLFVQLPPGIKIGQPRVPFFGGWDFTTWALVVCLCMNNFLIGDQLRRLTSVAKYVAYALGLCLSYFGQLAFGTREPNLIQAICCGGISLLAISYVWLPGPSQTNTVKKTQ